MKYSERQIGWIVIVPFLGILIMLYISYINRWGDNPISYSGLLIIASILIISQLLFFQMSTSVGNEKIKISYGIGLIKKSINLDTIEQIDIVRNKWYYGIGIRILTNGWLYNIQGLDAIELKLKKSNSIIRIGTADSNKLKREIESKITESTTINM